jgi:uncharacterized phiE125 gp8 family phage protein
MLINVQDVNSFLGIKVNTEDHLILPLLQSAQKEAENYCNQKFEGAEFTEYYNGEGNDCLIVDIAPIVSITSIHDDLDREYNSDDLIDSDDYTFDADAGIIWLDGLIFAKGIKNIKVVYKAGYGSGYADLPYDLKQALIYLTSAMYLEGQAGVNVFENQEIVYRPSYLKKEAYKLLDKYRRAKI